MSNQTLSKTQKAIATGDLSSDENYTRYIDISTELFYYKELLKGADVFCPCDFEESNFVKFFNTSKELYEINSFHYSGYNQSTNLGEKFQDSIPKFAKKYPNGIIVTNPPFSCISEFLSICEENKLKYLFIGPLTFSCHINQGCSYILSNKLWCGHNTPNAFILPDGTEKQYGNIVWYTNLKYKDCFNTLYLTNYLEHHSYKYSASHKEVLWVEKCDEIPVDYNKEMRVPMSYLLKHNPKQFELLYCVSDGSAMRDKNKKIVGEKITKTPDNKDAFMGFIIKRKEGKLI